jgi:hypothetical protein
MSGPPSTITPANSPHITPGTGDQPGQSHRMLAPLPFIHLSFIIERLLVNLAAIQAQIYSQCMSGANANQVTTITL